MGNVNIVIVLGLLLSPLTALQHMGQKNDRQLSTTLGKSAFELFHAESTSSRSTYVIDKDVCGSSVQDVDCIFISNCTKGEWVEYYDVNFGNGAVAIKLALAYGYNISSGSGKIDIRLNGTATEIIGTITTGYTGGWESWIVIEQFLARPITGGIDNLYFTFDKDCSTYDCETYPEVANIDWFMFYDKGE